MAIVQKAVPVVDTLIYSRVMAMQLTDEAMKVENIFKYELTPIPTLLFNEEGNLRAAKFLHEAYLLLISQ